jgi:hypothetical protein
MRVSPRVLPRVSVLLRVIVVIVQGTQLLVLVKLLVLVTQHLMTQLLRTRLLLMHQEQLHQEQLLCKRTQRLGTVTQLLCQGTQRLGKETQRMGTAKRLVMAKRLAL